MFDQDQNIVEHSVKLSIIEVALGSIIHVFKVPFGGHFMSLNQGFYLLRSLKLESNRLVAARGVMEISTIVAILKSLSPAGKKLGPMISISMQGFLFMSGLIILGNNFLGHILAMLCLSIWAFLQPIITYFLMFGPDFYQAFLYLIEKLNDYISVSNETVFLILSSLIIIKFLLAVFIVFAVKFLNKEKLQSYENKIQSIAPKSFSPNQTLSTKDGVVKDMTRPFFIFSILLMGLFFLLTGLDWAIVLWKILRALAIAFVIFYLSRSNILQKFITKYFANYNWVQRLLKLTQLAYKKIMN